MATIKHRAVLFIVLVGVVILGSLVFEPVTRELVAVDSLCGYCHVDQEYRSDVRLAYSMAHPPLEDEVEISEPSSTSSQPASPEQSPQATCVECHLPPGLLNSFYAYSHFASLTDLFGHFRDRMAERDGAWIAARQAAAYRVRDRLFEQDSPTCRYCHVEEEIKPKRERGKNAHQKALDEQMTCIECHYNEKHQSVDLRRNAFEKPPMQKTTQS